MNIMNFLVEYRPIWILLGNWVHLQEGKHSSVDEIDFGSDVKGKNGLEAPGEAHFAIGLAAPREWNVVERLDVELVLQSPQRTQRVVGLPRRIAQAAVLVDLLHVVAPVVLGRVVRIVIVSRVGRSNRGTCSHQKNDFGRAQCFVPSHLIPFYETGPPLGVNSHLPDCPLAEPGWQSLPGNETICPEVAAGQFSVSSLHRAGAREATGRVLPSAPVLIQSAARKAVHF